MNKYLRLIPILIFGLNLSAIAQNDYGFQLIGRALPGEASASQVIDNNCYLGAGNCLQIYNIANPSHPIPLGQIPLQGLVEDVSVINNLAYIANGTNGLVIADISVPSEIQIRGQLQLTDEAFGIQIQGDYAFVAGLSAGFVAIDISDPSAPSQVGSFPVDWAALNVDVLNNIACVASGYGGLYILDISSPSNPTQLGLVDTQDTWAYDVKINDNYAYMAYSLASGGGGLKVIDISNPAVPVVRSNLYIETSLRRMDYSSGYVVAAGEDGGLFVIEVANPYAPRVVGGWHYGYGNNIDYANNRIYLSGGKEGLYIFNAANMNFPSLLSATPTYSSSQDVTVSGQYAYIVEQPSGLKAINISNIRMPLVTYSRQFCWENNAYQGVSSGVSVVDNKLYVSDFADMLGGRHDFRAYGLDNPEQPESLSVYGNLNIGVRGHAVRNDIAYLSNSSDLKILDVRNGSNMQLLNTFNGGWDFAYGMDLVGNYIYVGTMDTGLKILDITNETRPEIVGSFDTNGQTFTAKYHDGYIYLPDYEQGLRIVNVANPAAPFEVGHFSTYQNCVDVAFIDTRTDSYAIAAFDDQIVALNIADPSNPVEVGYFESGDPRRLCTRGDTIFVADRIAGLYIFLLDVQVGVTDDQTSPKPEYLNSLRNYPNPFNPQTTISFDMPVGNYLTVDIYDILGRHTIRLLDGYTEPGQHRIIWDGKDSHGNQVSQGVFFYKLYTGGKSYTGKMILLK